MNKEQREKISDYIYQKILGYNDKVKIEIRWWAVNQLQLIYSSDFNLNHTFEIMADVANTFPVDTIEYYADDTTVNVKFKVNS